MHVCHGVITSRGAPGVPTSCCLPKYFLRKLGGVVRRTKVTRRGADDMKSVSSYNNSLEKKGQKRERESRQRKGTEVL